MLENLSDVTTESPNGLKNKKKKKKEHVEKTLNLQIT